MNLLFVTFTDLVHFATHFLVLLGQRLVLSLDDSDLTLQLFDSLFVEGYVFVFKFELFVESVEPQLELVLVILSRKSERVELVGQKSDLIVLLFEHVNVAFVFLLESGYFLVFLLDLFLQKLYFLLQNGPFLFHFHPDHL